MLSPYGNVMAIHGSALLIFFNNFRTFFRDRSVDPKIVKHVVFFQNTISIVFKESEYVNSKLEHVYYR